MIAACPKCAARYRIERERLEAGGVRLRCARCEAVFRVRPPAEEQAAPAAPPAPAPKPVAAAAAKPAAARPAAAVTPAAGAPSEVVLVAMRDGDAAKHTADLLEAHGYQVVRANDGVEAMLEIQRRLPRAVVLAADLPKMFGFQICEILKRNPSLRRTWVVLVGAIHHPDRYRREAGELYGADAYLESPDLPDGILPLLVQGNIHPSGAPSAPPPAPAPAPKPAPKILAPEPRAPVLPPREAPAAAARPRRDDGLDEERAKAERLARIVVSDIVLYNEERFTAAARAGNVVQAMSGDLAEGRALFDERIDPRVRAERDYLTDELVRSAKLRGMK